MKLLIELLVTDDTLYVVRPFRTTSVSRWDFEEWCGVKRSDAEYYDNEDELLPKIEELIKLNDNAS